MVLGKQGIHMLKKKKQKTKTLISLCSQIYSKWTRDSNIRPKTPELAGGKDVRLQLSKEQFQQWTNETTRNSKISVP